MNELQAGVELSLAVLSQSSIFSSQAKLRSTIQRLGITLKVCRSRRLVICPVTY